jgi:TPR repeat protein
VKWYRKAAEQGLADAQHALGVCYANGLGVAKDEAEAVKWYRKAAEQGNASAQGAIGRCYANGRGVVKNESEAAKWYSKAAEQGDAWAQCALGVCYDNGQGVAKDGAEAVQWYRKAAEQEDAGAQLNLGLCYANGRGVVKNESEAAKLYRKAAEQGDANAQCYLGQCYENGKGVIKGDIEAVKWYRKSAEQGCGMAQYGLALCYENGRGVVKDATEAYKWCLLAGAQGYPNGGDLSKGIFNFSKEMFTSSIEQKLSPAQRAEGQLLAREWKPKLTTQEDSPDAPTTQEATDKPRFTGTGFLVTRNGYLVTNHHVVKNSSKVRVQTAAGLLDAEVVRVDTASDLALLKVKGTFDALPVVSSSKSRLGSMVATVGFPNVGIQGFEPKLSKGEISSLAGIKDDEKQFQISVPIQHGNSGGALVDERGNVVGIVCAQLSQKEILETTGTVPQNVNYAIKSIYLLNLLKTTSEVGGGLIEAKTNEQKFEAMVDDVKKATVLIIGY